MQCAFRERLDPVDGQAVHISCAILTSSALWEAYRALSDVQALTVRFEQFVFSRQGAFGGLLGSYIKASGVRIRMLGPLCFMTGHTVCSEQAVVTKGWQCQIEAVPKCCKIMLDLFGFAMICLCDFVRSCPPR